MTSRAEAPVGSGAWYDVGATRGALLAARQLRTERGLRLLGHEPRGAAAGEVAIEGFEMEL